MEGKEFTGIWLATWFKPTETISRFCVVLCKNSDESELITILLEEPFFPIKNFKVAQLDHDYAKKEGKSFLRIVGKVMTDATTQCFHIAPNPDELTFGRYKDLYHIIERLNACGYQKVLKHAIFAIPIQYIYQLDSETRTKYPRQRVFSDIKKFLDFSGEEE